MIEWKQSRETLSRISKKRALLAGYTFSVCTWKLVSLALITFHLHEVGELLPGLSWRHTIHCLNEQPGILSFPNMGCIHILIFSLRQFFSCRRLLSQAQNRALLLKLCRNNFGLRPPHSKQDVSFQRPIRQRKWKRQRFESHIADDI